MAETFIYSSIYIFEAYAINMDVFKGSQGLRLSPSGSPVSECKHPFFVVVSQSRSARVTSRSSHRADGVLMGTLIDTEKGGDAVAPKARLHHRS